MKKTILSLIIISIFTMTLSASDLYAQLFTGDYEIGNSSNIGYGGTFGFSSLNDNKFMFGMHSDFISTSFKDSDYETNSSNILLVTCMLDFGYDVYNGITPYFTAGVQTYSLFGYEYGVGVKYQLMNYIAVDVKYTRGTLYTLTGKSSLASNYVQAGLEFNFKTK